MNLQLFAEGASAGATGEGASTGVNGDSPVSQGDDLSKVVYGKSNQAVAEPAADDVSAHEDKTKAFDELIKKGGQYAEEFNKRTQSIIDKRFKDVKNMQSTLDSHSEIMDTLAAKYGVDASDIKALKKAIDNDTSMYEEAAFKEGLSVDQYKEKLALQKENARLKAAEEEAVRNQHAQDIYAKWLSDADEMVAKYNIQNFDLAKEMENEDFTRLLGNGTSFEAAYKAIHFDEMLGGAMAQTAANVERDLANRVASRHSRPSENSIESSNATVFKSDVNKFTDADIDEIIRRVRRGEQISL